MTIAPFSKRLAAFLIDLVVGGVLTAVCAVIPGLIGGASAAAGWWPANHSTWDDVLNQVVIALMGLFGLAAWWLYGAWPESSRSQASFGKQALGIAVTDAAGGRLSFGRASARQLAKLVSALPFGLGFVMAAFDAEGRALHDRLARARVVLREAN